VTLLQNKLHVKKNDLVLVLSGKDRGKKGVILDVPPRKNRVIVEGINLIQKHMRPSPEVPQGGVIEKEGTIHISNLKLVCPKCDAPTRTRPQTLEKEVGGRTKKYRVRVCKKCGEVAERD